jgi:hypothetical protein
VRLVLRRLSFDRSFAPLLRRGLTPDMPLLREWLDFALHATQVALCMTTPHRINFRWPVL